MSPGGSGQSGNLADLTVQFVLKGKEELQAGVKEIQAGIASFAAAVQQLGSQMVAALQSAAAAAQKAGGSAAPMAAAFTASAAQIQNSITAFGAATQQVQAQMQAAMQNIADAAQKTAASAAPMGAAFTGIASKIKSAFVALGSAAVQALQGQIGGALGQLGSAATSFGSALKRTTSLLLQGLNQVSAAAKDLAGKLEGLTTILTRMAGSLQIGLAAGIATLTGFVKAGLGAGAMGDQLDFALKRLSLTISGAFRPEILRLIDGINKATTWLASLSNETKQSMVQFVGLAAAMLSVTFGGLPGLVAGAGILGLTFEKLRGPLLDLVKQIGRLGEALQPLIDTVIDVAKTAIEGLTAALGSLNLELVMGIVKWAATITTFVLVLRIIPQIVAAIRSVITSIQALNVALIVQKALSGPAGWAQLAAGAAAAATALGVYIYMGKKAEEMQRKLAHGKTPGTGSAGNRGSDLMKTGGFEDLRSAYQRIAVAALRASAGAKDPQERMVEQQERANRTLDQIQQNTGNPRPVLSR